VSNDKRAADDAEREAFEAWANERELDLMPGYPGQYSDCNTDFAWGAWQARAALSSRADRSEPATGAVYGGKDSSDARDAERYRWLREQDDSGPLFVMYGSNGTWGECGHSDIYGELLDESIDEEIAKEAKK
jgi:hypothetical protein